MTGNHPTGKNYDVILIGGGVMGAATAYYLLKSDSQLKIALIERDPTYARASTPLSDGNLRVQFNIKENIQISLYGLEVLERFAEEMAVEAEKPDICFRQQGNLFIIDEGDWEEAVDGYELRKSLGCQVELLTPDEVSQVYPLYNLAGCTGAIFGPQDGSMDPLAVLMGYKRKAISLGAEFIHAEAVELLERAGRITGVRLSTDDQLSANTIVNTAGAWAPKIAQTAGADLPVEPTKRQVFVINTNVRPDHILPAIFFPSGLYCFHEDQGCFMVGKSLASDPISFDDFDWDRRVFEEFLWEELVALIPSFDRLKVTSGWAGLYAMNSLDGNAILGEWPELKGFYLANGFSGHGFQQCHAVGRYLTELILGMPISLDLSIFSPQRIFDNKPVLESKRCII